MTPAMLHYGAAEQVRHSRQRILEAAYATHPERFVSGPPRHPRAPAEVWINPPAKQPAQEKGHPEPQCPRKPGAPLTHPRLGYPSPSCVPAELDSVSPSANQSNESQAFEQVIEHPSHALKIPGVWGLAPISEEIESEAIQLVH